MAKLQANKEIEDFTSQPLDTLYIDVINKQGVKKQVRALHIGFAEAKVFVPYDVPPSMPFKRQESEKGPPQSSAEIEEWLERMEFLEEDLRWLLKLPHQRFWCQVVYDKELHSCLESYLSKAPRYYDLYDFLVNEAMKGILQRVHQLVFKIYLRMSTYKESKLSHITPSMFSGLIYENFLFDIPKIMDLCTLYGQNNQTLLRKMISNIFNMQPCYIDDLEAAAQSIMQALNTIEEKLGLLRPEDEDNSTSEPKKLMENSALTSLNRLTWLELQDIIIFLVDWTVALYSFLDVYPPANSVFHCLNAECRIAVFYETVFPPLKKELAFRSKDEKLTILVAEIKKRVTLAKASLVKIFHNMIFSSCIQPLLDITDGTNLSSCVYVEELLNIMSSVVSEKSFISSYQEKFPFEEILDLLSQSKFAPDTTRTDYILSALSANWVYKPQKPLATSTTSKRKKKKEEVPNSGTNYTNGDVESLPLEGATAGPVVVGAELQSLITQVQDLLPTLGPGFVEACLEYFNYDVEKVINGILEDSLPSALGDLDRKLESWLHGSSELHVPVAAVEPLPTPNSSVLGERRNIFDNDEFDVFNRDTVDVSRIHLGKRQNEEYGSLLDNEDEKHLIRAVCNRYDIISDTYDDPILYEDEYDDTYDEAAMGPEEPFKEDELTKQRPFTIPRVLRTGNESIEELEPEHAANNINKNNETIEKTDSQAGPSTSKDYSRHKPFGRPSLDVKGKAKGQGQDEKTVRNRNVKEKHKSSYANHNRKSQADRKRAQGMIHM